MMLIVVISLFICLLSPLCAEQASEIKASASERVVAPGLYTKDALVGKNDRQRDIEFNFNNASLKNISNQIEAMFDVVFLTDDAIQGAGLESQSLTQSKVTFSTARPMSKRRAWDLFQTLVGLAGFSVIPTNDPKIYRITSIARANRSPLPTFINSTLDLLPNNDERIRYVTTLTNAKPDQMKNLLEKLKSPTSVIDVFQELNALIITDTAYNTKAIMHIVQELDRSSTPQILSVLRLRQADAEEVADLIKQLQGKDSPGQRSAFAKKPATLYFVPQEATVLAEPRTNSLIIIGPKNAVARIEQVIQEQIDVSLKQMYEPVHTYTLNYAPAQQVADILNNVLQYGAQSGAGKTGGVRAGEKYFSNVYVQAETQSNRLIIRANKSDYEHLKTIIAQLDQRQPQVAIEVLIISLKTDELRQLGIQWNSKNDRKVNAQMSGFLNQSPPVIDPTTGSIISNLISLATLASAGSTVVSFGQQSVWAIFAAVQTLTESRVISNPFLVATNKYQSVVSVGETRRVQIGSVQGSTTPQPTFGNIDANLTVTATPQINSMGIITLEINVNIEQFSQPLQSGNTTVASAGNTDKRSVSTTAHLADSEVLALGGLIRTTQNNTGNSLPLLSRIPLVGNLFRNQSKTTTQDNLIVFICPKIIRPDNETSSQYTTVKKEFAKDVVGGISALSDNPRDPIFNWFFKPIEKDPDALVDDFFADKRPTSKINRPSGGIISGAIHNKAGGV